MPTWNQILREIEGIKSTSACDDVRSKYLKCLYKKTGRPIIAYYSGWLQKENHQQTAITDFDMNGFMSTIHGLDRSNGLDIILHTPGGGIEATRAIVEYIHSMFSRDIRVIVPQAALSAGTMIACAANVILMGKHSSLGPTDPQVYGHPAMVVLAEIDRAIEEIKKDNWRRLVWEQVFAKYPPAFIAECERAVDVTRDIVTNWLRYGMFSKSNEPEKQSSNIVKNLMDVNSTSSHAHHFMIDDCKKIGLIISNLEDDQSLQESVLSVHHAFTVSFSKTSAVKIIQNSDGVIWAVG